MHGIDTWDRNSESAEGTQNTGIKRQKRKKKKEEEC